MRIYTYTYPYAYMYTYRYRYMQANLTKINPRVTAKWALLSFFIFLVPI